MQIKTIHLKNYRGIEDLTVNFNSGVNLVIGNNGAGKSSLLAGISLILESMLFDIDANANKDFNRDDMRIISSLVGTITESIKYCVPVSVSCVFELEGTDYDTFYEYDENSQRDVTNVKYKTISKMNELVNNRNSRLPILSYQSDKRQFFTANDDPGRPYGQIERRQGYKDCVNGMASVEAIQNWCAQMDYAGYRFGHEVTEYVLFKKIVSRFIKELDDNDNVHIDFSPKLNRLVYSESGSGYLVHNLSAGYQSVLCLVMELAYRTALLNPNLGNSDDLEGIAVIDEIDMHLHPR